MSEPQESRSIALGEVFTGAVAGWILCWAVVAVFTFGTYASVGDSSSPWVGVLVGGSLAVTPLVLLGVVLVRRRRGMLIAGVLLGLTIGSVVGAGVCTTYVVLNMA